MRNALLLFAALLMAGCADNPVKETPAAPLVVPADSRTQLIVNFKADGRVLGNAHWDEFVASWRAAIQREASALGYRVSEQDGPILASTDPGLLLIIIVDDFRYATEAAGDDEPLIEARAIYLDAQTLKGYGERSYNTTSPAWEEISSELSNVQVRALTKSLVGEIGPPNKTATATATPSAPVAAPVAINESPLVS
ncbi:hypothetical protein [Metapseudomonas resinovorans]|uniref:Uncharacterized protein n=1 Tax=Metapseudomonas resinovorans NBRC 106553 TaxID=1245471 RepID=S6BJH9_METRE|nr:hypothetical protein [Pseudomonas resinovorans]BAN49359.1 hypothetical protein PCA10_36270 [Pseudomonas resinovorans NBRC 106553]